MGFSPGDITITHSTKLDPAPQTIHVEGKQMSGTVRVWLGVAEGLVPDFSISPSEARRMARHLEIAADYTEGEL